MPPFIKNFFIALRQIFVGTRNGRYPACVEVCPVGARKFGNLLDKDSEVRYVIENKRVFLLKEELNTQPKFFYFYGV